MDLDKAFPGQPADTGAGLVERTAEQAAGNVAGWLAVAREQRDAGRLDEARAVLDAAAQRFPGVGSIRHELARVAEAARDWPAAEQWWRAFIAIEPGTWWGYAGLAETLREQGRVDEAEAVLTAQFEALAAAPGIFVAYARLANRAHDWRAAEQRWDVVVSRFPAVSEGFVALSRALRELGRTEEARMLLTQAAERFPALSDIPHDLARLAEQRGDWPAAERYWRAFVSLEPRPWWGHSLLASALREQGRLAEAEAVLTEQFESFAGEPAIFAAYARIAEQRRDWAEAEARWADVTLRFPASAEGVLGQARVLRETGRNEQAWDLLSQAVERFPSQGMVYHDLARMAETRRDWSTAERCWRGFVAVEPRPWWGPTCLANVVREQGRMDEADAVLSQARERFPNEPGVLIDQARLAERQADWPRAGALWTLTVERFPHRWEGPVGAARALRSKGGHAEARQVLVAAAERFPAEATVLHELARAAEAERDWVLAESAWRRFIDVDPSRFWAHTGLAVALQEQSRLDDAADVLRAARLRFPSDAQVFLALARFVERFHGADAAISCWTEARRAFPDDAEMMRGLIAILVRAGRSSQAVSQLVLGQSIFPEVAWFVMEDARFAERQGNWADAEAIWRRAVEQFPEERECHFGLAGALREAGKLGDAAGVLRDAPGEEDSLWLMQHAQLAQAGNDFDTAIEYWRRCIALDPATEHWYVHCADCFSAARRYLDATEVLASGIDRLGRTRGLLLATGAAAERRRDWAAAVVVYREILARQGNDAETLVKLAFALGQGGRRDEGDDILRAAIARYPDDLSLSIAFAKMMPLTRAPAHDPEYVTRAQDTFARFPDAPEARRRLADALLYAHRLEEAEQLLATPHATKAGDLLIGPKAKISAFVITYNRANILGTCLRSLAFADELIVIDKSSTDGSRAVAEVYANEVVTVPWTPTVEETRTLALSLCHHEWILFMDDDECLSQAGAERIVAELRNPAADIYEFPLRHYILGQHDERAYYWPEHHVRLFRRGAVTFSGTVHAGLYVHSEKRVKFLVSDGVCIHHLSHVDTHAWIEKTNRYTSRSDRAGIKAGAEGFAAFAHERIDFWMARCADPAPDGYPAAVALLRAVYDMVDAVKAWEADTGLDGEALFAQACAALDAARVPR